MSDKFIVIITEENNEVNVYIEDQQTKTKVNLGLVKKDKFLTMGWMAHHIIKTLKPGYRAIIKSGANK